MVRMSHEAERLREGGWGREQHMYNNVNQSLPLFYLITIKSTAHFMQAIYVYGEITPLLHADNLYRTIPRRHDRQENTCGNSR